MSFFVHELGLCESADVGPRTRIWAFAHVLPGARIGADCNICDHVFVEGGAVVGDRVTVKCGVQIWDGVHLSDDVFVGPNVTFTNDSFPRSRQHLTSYPRTVVGPGASLGANSTVLPGRTIGRHAMVGAGAVVTKDVPPNAVVVGNPARIAGYVDSGGELQTEMSPSPTRLPESRVPGVSLLELTRAQDLRGSLAAMDFDGLPFTPQRIFTVYDVPSTDVRGAHAHRCCHQLLICVRGSVRAMVDDGHRRQEFVLDRPEVGLHMPPMIWGTQYRYTADAVLLVLASEPYDAEDYIRDHDQFLTEALARGNDLAGAEDRQARP